MKHRLSNGKRWRVERRHILGLCDYGNHTITIGPHAGPRTRELIDTTIHEVLHAEFPKWRHKKVNRVARSIARVVHWALKSERLLVCKG